MTSTGNCTETECNENFVVIFLDIFNEVRTICPFSVGSPTIHIYANWAGWFPKLSSLSLSLS